METNCVFTIVAKNYIGLALILEKSIRKYYNNVDFYIVIADEVESGVITNLPPNALIAKDILNLSDDIWYNMSFKYNLTEFCTSIKPLSFKYFINSKKYKKVIYLDPDIYFFSSIEPIFKELDNVSMVLTPHILQIPNKGATDSPESDWMTCGMFNLGFCGIRDTSKSKRILDWWHERLVSSCFNERLKGQFTDQKWMDFIPCFLESTELTISHKLGYNFAPWNFFEREIMQQEGCLKVKSRIDYKTINMEQLVFVHFSGYDYANLKDGIFSQHNIHSLKEYSDLTPIFVEYSKAIRDNANLFNLYINQQYSYNKFDDGAPIAVFHRRLYSSLIEHGETFLNPFSSNGKFYRLLKKKGMVGKSLTDNSKITKNNLNNIGTKLKYFNRLSRLLYWIIGAKRYFLLLRLLKPYSLYESQIHLIDSKFDTKNIL